VATPQSRHFIYPHRHLFAADCTDFYSPKHVSTVVFTQDKCVIYAAGTLHAREILSNKKRFPSGLDCSTPTKIYLFNRQLNQQQDLGIYMDIFILKCDLKSQQCHSYYYKEIKNA
jgi:hypothetical protein